LDLASGVPVHVLHSQRRRQASVSFCSRASANFASTAKAFRPRMDFRVKTRSGIRGREQKSHHQRNPDAKDKDAWQFQVAPVC